VENHTRNLVSHTSQAPSRPGTHIDVENHSTNLVSDPSRAPSRPETPIDERNQERNPDPSQAPSRPETQIDVENCGWHVASRQTSKPQTQNDSKSHCCNMASEKSHGWHMAADTSQAASQSDTQIDVENRGRHMAAASSPIVETFSPHLETPSLTSSSTALSHLQIFSSTRDNHQRPLKANRRAHKLQRSSSYRIPLELLRHKKHLSHSSQTLPHTHKLSRS